jgi:LCP family protein required for cell wall assembly
VLVLGSDARPKEDLLRSRSDSIHLVALDPKTGRGTIVGFPRDSYVEYPKGGRGRINEAMVRGGPQYAAETVRKLTGLPIQYYVVTGFVGLARMVDDLGGVDVLVDRKMNDRLSGARFQAGWHHFSGAQALAFSRNRHDVPDGDFTRSQHQGDVLLATLGKLRAEVGDDPGLLRWLEIMGRSVKLDVPADRLPGLAALARRTDPALIANVVLPGRVGTGPGGASVVYLTQDAPALFNDLRDNAVVG